MRYTIGELERSTGIQRRTIHFYVQNGIVDKPEGSKRGSYYTRTHLIQLLKVLKLRESGIGLQGIRQRIQSEDASDLPPAREPGTIAVYSGLLVADGIEVTVDTERAKLTSEQMRAFFKAVREKYREVSIDTGGNHASFS